MTTASGASVSRLDTIYRTLVLSKFFTDGWGGRKNLEYLHKFRKLVMERNNCAKLVDPSSVQIDTPFTTRKGYRISSGHFLSPFAVHFPEITKNAIRNAYFEVILPTEWPSEPVRPMVIQFAGTGDHGFFRRRRFQAIPLATEHGVGSVLLENPFYGKRKPKEQHMSCLRHVTDLFVMGACLILEGLVLTQWLKREGYGPVGLTGISMGGHMASLAATVSRDPVVLVPCLSWSTASQVFTRGVLSESIPWKLLENQYSSHFSNATELASLVESMQMDFAESTSLSAVYDQKGMGVDSHDDNCGGAIIGSKDPSAIIEKDMVSNSDTKESVNPITMSHSLIIDGFYYFLHNFLPRSTRRDKRQCPDAVFDFMKSVLDEFTHLKNFAQPVDQDLIIAVVAKKDAYIPRDQVSPLTELWPGAELWLVDSGHIYAFLRHQPVFRAALLRALQRACDKYYDGAQIPMSKLSSVEKRCEKLQRDNIAN